MLGLVSMRAIFLGLLLAASCGAPAERPASAEPVQADKVAPAPMTRPEQAERRGPLLGLLSAGYSHQCCINPSSQVVCNGSNKQGQFDAPKGKYQAVSAGLYATCALDTSGQPRCWGGSAPAVEPAAGARYAGIAAGHKFACGLRDSGTVDCWGAGDFESQLDGTFSTIVAGSDHVCGLRKSGEVACAGRPGRPDIKCVDLEDVPGARCQPEQMVPRSWTQPPADLRARLLAGGEGHTCAVDLDDRVVCWGAWGYGDGNTVWSGHMDVPTKFAAPIVKLTAGGGLTCALLDTGAVSCWGYQKSPEGTFVDIDGGSSGVCGVRASGAMECVTYSSFMGLKLDTTPLTCRTPPTR
jgi:alpha-tubulin suppressor-like RCC1 family protein